MVGVVIITHGDMAKGIETSVELIIGKQEQFKTIGLYEDTDFEEFKGMIGKTVEGLDTGNGVLVLVDLFGASPYNAAAYNMATFKEKKIPIRLVTGVNLPMVIEVLMQRDSVNSPDELYPISLESGKEGIKEALEELEKLM